MWVELGGLGGKEDLLLSFSLVYIPNFSLLLKLKTLRKVPCGGSDGWWVCKPILVPEPSWTKTFMLGAFWFLEGFLHDPASSPINTMQFEYVTWHQHQHYFSTTNVVNWTLTQFMLTHLLLAIIYHFHILDFHLFLVLC